MHRKIDKLTYLLSYNEYENIKSHEIINLTEISEKHLIAVYSQVGIGSYKTNEMWYTTDFFKFHMNEDKLDNGCNCFKQKRMAYNH